MAAHKPHKSLVSHVEQSLAEMLLEAPPVGIDSGHSHGGVVHEFICPIVEALLHGRGGVDIAALLLALAGHGGSFVPPFAAGCSTVKFTLTAIAILLRGVRPRALGWVQALLD